MEIKVDFSGAKRQPSDKEEELLKEHIRNLYFGRACRCRHCANQIEEDIFEIRSWIKVLRKYRLLKEMAKTD